MVAHICNPSNREAEAEVPDQPRLHSKILFQKHQQQQKNVQDLRWFLKGQVDYGPFIIVAKLLPSSNMSTHTF